MVSNLELYFGRFPSDGAASIGSERVKTQTDNGAATNHANKKVETQTRVTVCESVLSTNAIKGLWAGSSQVESDLTTKSRLFGSSK